MSVQSNETIERLLDEADAKFARASAKFYRTIDAFLERWGPRRAEDAEQFYTDLWAMLGACGEKALADDEEEKLAARLAEQAEP